MIIIRKDSRKLTAPIKPKPPEPLRDPGKTEGPFNVGVTVGGKQVVRLSNNFGNKYIFSPDTGHCWWSSNYLTDEQIMARINAEENRPSADPDEREDNSEPLVP